MLPETVVSNNVANNSTQVFDDVSNWYQRLEIILIAGNSFRQQSCVQHVNIHVHKATLLPATVAGNSVASCMGAISGFCPVTNCLYHVCICVTNYVRTYVLDPAGAPAQGPALPHTHGHSPAPPGGRGQVHRESERGRAASAQRAGPRPPGRAARQHQPGDLPEVPEAVPQGL